MVLQALRPVRVDVAPLRVGVTPLHVGVAILMPGSQLREATVAALSSLFTLCRIGKRRFGLEGQTWNRICDGLNKEKSRLKW